MPRITTVGVAMLLCMGSSFSHAQSDACAVNPATLNGIRSGGMSLFFDRGSLEVESTVAIDRGSEHRFNIQSASGVRFAFTRALRTGQQAKLAFHASELTTLKGIWRQEVHDKGCVNTYRFDANALRGARARQIETILPNALGGVLRVVSGDGRLTENSLIQVRRGGVEGRIAITIGTATIAGARIVLPQAQTSIVTLSSAPKTVVDIQVDLLDLVPRIRRGTLGATNVTIRDGIIAVAGARLERVTGVASRVVVNVSDNPVLEFRGLTADIAAVRHEGGFAFNGTKAVAKASGRFSWRAVVDQASVRASEQGGVAADFQFTCAVCTYVGKLKNRGIEGAGTVNVNRLTDADVDARIALTAPTLPLGRLLPFKVAITSLTGKLSGKKAESVANGTLEISNLSLPNLAASGKLGGVWSFKAGADSLVTNIRLAKAKMVLGTNESSGLVEGVASSGEVSAVITTATEENAQVLIAPKHLQAVIALSKSRIPLIGGDMSFGKKPLEIFNDKDLTFAPSAEPATLKVMSDTITLAQTKLAPTNNGLARVIQEKPVQLDRPDIRLRLSNADGLKPPFLLWRLIELPGFAIRPPDGIKSVTAEISGYDLEVDEIAASGVTLVVEGDKLVASLRGFRLGTLSITTPADERGRPRVQPAVSGRFTKPIVVDRFFWETSLIHEPLRVFEFGLEGFELRLAQATYASDAATISDGTLEARIKRLTSKTLDGELRLIGAKINWADSSEGFARVRNASVNLSGDRAKPNGSITLDVPSVRLKGLTDVEVGSDKRHVVFNCKIVVPVPFEAYLSDITGTITLAGGIPRGRLTTPSAASVDLNWSGVRDCVFNWRARISWRIEYPCGGTINWGDWVRTCEGRDDKEFLVPLTLSARNLNVFANLTEIEYGVKQKTEDDGTVKNEMKMCHVRLDKLLPSPKGGVPLQVNVEPDWRYVPDWLRGAGRAVYDIFIGPLFAFVETYAVITIISLPTFVGLPIGQRSDECAES